MRGKSAALRELEICIGSQVKQKIVLSASTSHKGSADDLRNFLERKTRKTGDPSSYQYQGFCYSIHHSWIQNWQAHVRNFIPLFCSRIATENRITDSNPQGAIAILDDPPSHPIHILYADDRVERRISSYFQKAFGKELIVFRAGGGTWPLMVGERPQLQEGGEHPYSATYNERLRGSARPLQGEGDGMRSFASVILHVLSPNTPSVLLLDEPEAFLHPPQARLIGEFLAKERPKNSQLFVATHSVDVLQGILNTAPDHLRVLRIQRVGLVNHIKELDKDRAKGITADPLMKYSSVLSGVFYQRVIICESDADIMFYNAILDTPSVHGNQSPDVLFVHAAGKQRMALLAEALRALDVQVDVVADIDILNDEAVLKRLIEALGGSWPTFEKEAVPLKKAIEQNKPWLNSAEVAKGIKDIVDKAPSDGQFPSGLRAEIEKLFRKASPWDAVKDAGESAIPSGQPTQHYVALRQLCSSIGAWIVPVGELEGFCRSIGGHGPRWVQQVIEQRDIGQDRELAIARNFVSKIWARAR